MKLIEESFEKKWFESGKKRHKNEEDRENRTMKKEQEHESSMMGMFM